MRAECWRCGTASKLVPTWCSFEGFEGLGNRCTTCLFHPAWEGTVSCSSDELASIIALSPETDKQIDPRPDFYVREWIDDTFGERVGTEAVGWWPFFWVHVDREDAIFDVSSIAGDLPVEPEKLSAYFEYIDWGASLYRYVYDGHVELN